MSHARFESCEEVDRGLWQYVDRELSAGDLALLSAHLKECQRCRDLFHERSREANLYRTVLTTGPFGDAFADRLKGRMQKEGLLEGEWREPRTPRHRQRHPGDRGPSEGVWEAVPFARQKAWRRVAVLGLVLVIPVAVVSGILLRRHEGTVLGAFEVQGGPAQLTVKDLEGNLARSQGPVTQGELLAGSVLHVPKSSQAILRVKADGAGRDDSTLTVDGPADLSIGAGATRAQIQAMLYRGSLVARVSKRLPAESFVIFTPLSQARVVGTEFWLEVDDDGRTLLKVTEGVVRFEAVRDFSPRRAPVSVSETDGAYFVTTDMAVPAPVSEAADAAPAGSAPAEGAPAVTAPSVEIPIAPPPAPAAGATGADGHLDTPVSGKEPKER